MTTFETLPLTIGVDDDNDDLHQFTHACWPYTEDLLEHHPNCVHWNSIVRDEVQPALYEINGDETDFETELKSIGIEVVDTLGTRGRPS